MAFENENNSGNVRQFKQADAFINLSIAANTDSGRTKLGNGVRLSLERNSEKEIIELYKQSVAAGKEHEFNEWLKSQLIVDVKLNGTGGAELAVEKPSFLEANG